MPFDDGANDHNNGGGGGHRHNIPRKAIADGLALLAAYAHENNLCKACYIDQFSIAVIGKILAARVLYDKQRRGKEFDEALNDRVGLLLDDIRHVFENTLDELFEQAKKGQGDNGRLS